MKLTDEQIKETPRYKLLIALSELMFLNGIVNAPSMVIEGDNYGTIIKMEISIDRPIGRLMSDIEMEMYGKEEQKVGQALRKIEEFINHRNEIIREETERLIKLGCHH